MLESCDIHPEIYDFIYNESKNNIKYILVVSGILRVSGSLEHLPVGCNLQTNKKTTVVFCRPSDGKVSIFLEDLELRAAVISIKNLIPHLV